MGALVLHESFHGVPIPDMDECVRSTTSIDRASRWLPRHPRHTVCLEGSKAEDRAELYWTMVLATPPVPGEKHDWPADTLLPRGTNCPIDLFCSGCAMTAQIVPAQPLLRIGCSHPFPLIRRYRQYHRPMEFRTNFHPKSGSCKSASRVAVSKQAQSQGLRSLDQ